MWFPAGVGNPLGAFCLVDGTIASVDSQAQPIRFRVALPARWNGKTLHLGGGGFNGVPVLSDRGVGSEAVLLAPPLPAARGYVVFGSDSGHQALGVHGDIDASFSLNEEQLRNFAGEQLQKTHDAVLFLVKRNYDAAPVHSYFLGGSEGGREALTAIQRYPEDYDGVISVFPTLALTAVLLKFQTVILAMQAHGGIGNVSKDRRAASS